MGNLSQARALAAAFIYFVAVQGLMASDEQWSREFFPGSASGSRIRAMISTGDGKLIYAGSYLASEDDTIYPAIVVQDGETRIPIGKYSVNVYALAVDGNNIYAGGEFTSMSGYSITNLARWDGKEWSAVGGGVSGGPVRALAIKDGNLYVGGGFTNAGNIAASGLAKWDGARWTVPGRFIQINSYTPQVRALQFIGDSLFVGGAFDRVDSLSATNIVELTGGKWRTLATNGIVTSVWNPGVDAMAANSLGELFVGGSFSRAGDVDASFVAKWDGSKWSALKNGVSRESVGSVDAMFCSGNYLYVGGGFRYIDGVFHFEGAGLARWDGENWSDVNAPFYEGVTAITDTAAGIYVAGPIRSPGYPRDNGDQAGIARFDGSRWHVSGGVDRPVFAGTVADGKLRIATSQNLYSEYLYIADWDGLSWTAIGKVSRPFFVNQLAHKNGITYAIGSFTDIDGVPVHHVAAYDRSHWSALGAGLNYPTSMAFRGTNLLAADSNGIQMWTNNAWIQLLAPSTGQVQSIAVDGDIVFAAVNTSTSNGYSSDVIRFVNGQASSLGFNGDGKVADITVSNHQLYAGGWFTKIGGVEAKMIAHWDGQSWSELGGGLTETRLSTGPPVHHLEPDGEGGIFISGNFTQVGNRAAFYIAHWDGEQWRPLGSGAAGADTLHLEGRDLYAFGEMSTAGRHPSSGIAKWHLAELELFPQISSPNGFNFQARGAPNRRFIVQQTSDFQVWQNISTNTLVTNKLNFSLQAPATQRRFLRLISDE